MNWLSLRKRRRRVKTKPKRSPNPNPDQRPNGLIIRFDILYIIYCFPFAVHLQSDLRSRWLELPVVCFDFSQGCEVLPHGGADTPTILGLQDAGQGGMEGGAERKS